MIYINYIASKRYYLLLIIICVCINSYSQNSFYSDNANALKTLGINYKSAPDSSLFPYTLKAGNYYVLNDNLFFIESDTIIYITDSVGIRYNQNIDSRQFYNQLQQRSNKNRLTRELYGQLIRKQKSNPGNEFLYRTDYFNKFKGKTIRSISLNQLNIFGPTVIDTGLTSNKKTEQLVNRTHINTHSRQIYNSLLFAEGENLQPTILSDNERILRNKKTLHEAKILVTPAQNDSNSVDILVLTQDAFPFQLGGQIFDRNSGKTEVNHNNILGTTHRLINRMYFDRSGNMQKGYSGTYRIPQISKSFVATDIDYQKLYYQEFYGLKLYRNFITPEIKYAGAASLYFYNTQPQILINDSLQRRNLKYNITDIWAGRNFRLSGDHIFKGFRPGINIALRYSAQNFKERPEVFSDSISYYYNTKRIIGKLGYSNQKFYTSNMIYSSGKTEDIPIGYLIEFIAGTEFDDFNKRAYLGSNIAFATTFNKRFYLYNNISTGSYLNASNFDQGIFHCYSKIISPLIKTKGPLLRQFIAIGYTQGYKRKAHEYIGLNNGYGLKSWNKTEPIGNYRFTLKTETVIFPKWYYYGVGSTIFAFYDMGTIGKTPTDIFKTKAYSSIGLGFRLRNDNFVFNSVEIRLSWFPVVPEGNNWNYYLSSEQTLNLNELKPGKPEFVIYE